MLKLSGFVTGGIPSKSLEHWIKPIPELNANFRKLSNFLQGVGWFDYLEGLEDKYFKYLVESRGLINIQEIPGDEDNNLILKLNNLIARCLQLPNPGESFKNSIRIINGLLFFNEQITTTPNSEIL